MDVIPSLSINDSVDKLLNGGILHHDVTMKKREWSSENILHVYYKLSNGKGCHNCLIKFRDDQPINLPVNCPHAGICDQHSNYVGACEILSIGPKINNKRTVKFQLIKDS